MMGFIENKRDKTTFILLNLIRNHLGAWYWVYADNKDCYIAEPFIHHEDATASLEAYAKKHNLRYIVIDESIADCPELFVSEKADADV